MQMVTVSLPTFHKQFVAVYGRTPGAEIRRVKLERAQYYLRMTKPSICRMSELCGYGQHAKFSNFFKRETGQSPLAYRQAPGQ